MKKTTEDLLITIIFIMIIGLAIALGVDAFKTEIASENKQFEEVVVEIYKDREREEIVIEAERRLYKENREKLIQEEMERRRRRRRRR